MNDDQFQELRTMMVDLQAGQADVISRMHKMDARLGGVEDGQAGLAERMDSLEDGQTSLVKRMHKMETRLDGVESKLTSVRDEVSHLRDDMNSRFDQADKVQREVVDTIGAHVEEHDEALEDHEVRLTRLERHAA